MSKKASSKTKVTRIKAKATATKKSKPKSTKAASSQSATKTKKKTRKVPKIFRPLAALGNYFRQSFQELKKVKWPTRKETWSMTLAVIAYAVFLGVIVLLLDNLFDWLAKLIIK